MKKNVFVLLSMLCFALNSCLTPQYVTNVSVKGGLEKAIEKSVLVIGLDNLHIHNYQKTFDKNYESEEVFVDNFTNTLLKQIENTPLFKRVSVDNSSQWNHISSVISKGSYLKIDNLFSKSKVDYVICLGDIEIRERIKETQSSHNHIGDDDHIRGSTSTSRTEYVVVKTNVVVYEVKTRKLVLEFDVFGEKSVTFFNYSFCLEEAKNNAAMHAINYLKTGEM
jgi:hypothetical protein